MHLALSFLGPFQVTLDDQPATFATDRARALLAYLAVEADRPHRRETLAGLLWPNRPEVTARRNLSQTLARLRRAIHDQHAVPPFLQITRKTIQFDAATAELDVTRFQTLLATCAVHPRPGPPAVRPAHSRTNGRTGETPASRLCLERLEAAAALYQGEFLQGLFLADSQPFEEWASLKREQLHRQALDILHLLTTYYQGQGAYDRAQRYAECQLALEPWREEAHRGLMRSLALGGQRGAALAQYEICCRLLTDELGVGPAEETVALYEQIRAEKLGKGAEEPESGGKIIVAPLLFRPSVPLHNLPSQTTPFVGREQELAELARLLADPGVRLVTILGPGGMGKTRLAIEAAQAQLDAFAHGVRFVPLAPVAPADSAGSTNPLITALGDALDFAFQGSKSPREQLLAYLRGKEMLIVFDNFDHLLEAVDLVGDLISHAPRIKVLVTSRERLNLQEEWLFPLQGMRVPDEAVLLFEQHARQVQPDFDLVAERAWVIRICQLVDGLPLGIELAAAWTRLMPPQTIAQEIEGSIDFLATTLRNVPERHRSLRAVFDQSWDRLSEAEQAVLAKLSVFRGGFQREVAEAVTGTSLWLLSSLADKSLLHVTPSGRYEIRELLRQYVAEKLRGIPGQNVTALGHTAQKQGQITQAEPLYLESPKIRRESDSSSSSNRLSWA